MKKSDINKVRIDILSNQESALSIMLSRDGNIMRQGNGKLPIDHTNVFGGSSGLIFKALIDMLDQTVFPHVGLYDHPNKVGIPLTFSIAFQAKDESTAAFEFRFGSETKDVGELLPFFDNFILQAVSLTNEWYEQEKSKQTSTKN